MDKLQEMSPVFWMITTAITTISSLVLGIITWFKSAKMMPKEITKADLENKGKELSLVEQYDEIATMAALRAVNAEQRFQSLENENKEMRERLLSQEKTINEQSETMRMQSIRLDGQEERMKAQDKEIVELVQELTLSQAYNAALINQIRKENLTPVDLSSIDVTEYKNGVNGTTKQKRAYRKKSQE